jgi:hypothetical protein
VAGQTIELRARTKVRQRRPHFAAVAAVHVWKTIWHADIGADIQRERVRVRKADARIYRGGELSTPIGRPLSRGKSISLTKITCELFQNTIRAIVFICRF